jgi:hypothetical protein
MRNPRFKCIKPNYRKSVLEITLQEGRKITRCNLPFAVFPDVRISSKNRFVTIAADKELDDQGASFVLEDGTRGDFPADFVLYFLDPAYQWSPVNQLKRALKSRLASSKISVRVLADALNTSPSQVVRLFKENRASKQLLQLCQLAQIAGCQIEFTLKKRHAA